MAHFVKPPGSGSEGYDADNNGAPGSLWRVRVPLRGTRTVALWGGAGLKVTSNNPTVVPNDRLKELAPAGDLRVFELYGASAGGSWIDVWGQDNAFWIRLQAQVTAESVDPALLARTDELVKLFDAAIAKLAAANDLRVFFTFAHAYITKKIRKHIGLFAAPNPLLKLNDSFATTFLNAVNGTPHAGWQSAFRVCSGLSTAEREGFLEFVALAPISFEVCGACMAKVHITRDLKDALKAVKGVNPQDYGNVLIFVSEGNLYAEVQIRGRAKGALMLMTSAPIANKMKMNAKLWRNQVFKEVYGQDVPEPSADFVSAYHKAEGR
jgi:hypothetical protein